MSNATLTSDGRSFVYGYPNYSGSGTHGYTVRIVEVSSGKEVIPSMKFERGVDLWYITGMRFAFSPDGKILAMRSEGAITLYSMPGVAELYSIKTTSVPKDSIGRLNVTFAPDGNVISYNAGRKVVLYDLEARKEIGSVAGSDSEAASKMMFSQDGKRIAIPISDPSSSKTQGDDSRRLMIWDVNTLQPLVSIPAGTFVETLGGYKFIMLGSNGELYIPSPRP